MWLWLVSGRQFEDTFGCICLAFRVERISLRRDQAYGSSRHFLACAVVTDVTSLSPKRGFSPVWPSIWFFKTHFDMNCLWQDLQIRVLKMAFRQCGEASRFWGLQSLLTVELRGFLSCVTKHMVLQSSFWHELLSQISQDLQFRVLKSEPKDQTIRKISLNVKIGTPKLRLSSNQKKRSLQWCLFKCNFLSNSFPQKRFWMASLYCLKYTQSIADMLTHVAHKVFIHFQKFSTFVTWKIFTKWAVCGNCLGRVDCYRPTCSPFWGQGLEYFVFYLCAALALSRICWKCTLNNSGRGHNV